MLGNDIEVRKSRIEGRGVFALREFHPGGVVTTWDTSNTLSDEQYKNLSDDQRRYVTRYQGGWLFMQEPASYINHSCEPNTRALNGHDVAIAEIHMGDEITSDYRPEMKVGEEMKCRCGTKGCLGYIIGTGL